MSLISFAFDTALHVREHPDPKALRVRYGVDFGWTNPSAIEVEGLDGDGRLWVLDEFYKTQASAEDLMVARLTDFARSTVPDLSFATSLSLNLSPSSEGVFPKMAFGVLMLNLMSLSGRMV